MRILDLIVLDQLDIVLEEQGTVSEEYFHPRDPVRMFMLDPDLCGLVEGVDGACRDVH